MIAFANNKGGSGKTTTCANVGYSLSILGRRVLLIDGDMQMNLTLSFFEEEKVLEMASGKRNLYEAVLEERDFSGDVYPTRYPNLDLIPSSTLMSGIEYELFTKEQSKFLFKNGLKGIRCSGDYEYILVDAPPTLGGWVMNILCASDAVILPIEASPWGLFGMANMFDFLEAARKDNQALELLGIVLTKVDARKKYYKQSLESLHQMDGVRVFETVIRIDREVEWAQDSSEPIMVHKKSARSAGEYLALAKEIDQLCQ